MFSELKEQFSSLKNGCAGGTGFCSRAARDGNLGVGNQNARGLAGPGRVLRPEPRRALFKLID